MELGAAFVLLLATAPTDCCPRYDCWPILPNIMSRNKTAELSSQNNNTADKIIINLVSPRSCTSTLEIKHEVDRYSNSCCSRSSLRSFLAALIICSSTIKCRNYAQQNICTFTKLVPRQMNAAKLPSFILGFEAGFDLNCGEKY